jgi:Rieske Fe-S protein
MNPPDTGPDRRTVLAAATLSGLALPLIAGCGDAIRRSAAGAGAPSGRAPNSSAPSGSAPSSSASSGGRPLGPTSEVPVGGGHIFTVQQVVVTQPKAGEFKAFSAVCTHQGCLVSSVADGQIRCPCHGSSFSATDGSVVGGPAPAPLPAERIKVSGGTISLA